MGRGQGSYRAGSRIIQETEALLKEAEAKQLTAADVKRMAKQLAALEKRAAPIRKRTAAAAAEAKQRLHAERLAAASKKEKK